MKEKEFFNFSLEQENDLLWSLNEVNFDYIFLYEATTDRAKIYKIQATSDAEPYLCEHFSSFLDNKVHPDDIPILEREIENIQYFKPEVFVEVRLKETNGRRFRWHSIHMRLAEVGGSYIYVGSSTFVDSRKDKENDLFLKAHHDPLTGLYNKVTIYELVRDYLKKYPNTEAAMIVLDIDSFKWFNDCLGHMYGDEIIKEVADRLCHVFNDNALVGRIGGDEFLVFIHSFSTEAVILDSLNSLSNLLNMISLGRRDCLNITYSAGIAMYPGCAETYEELFKKADVALYYVKNHGKNGIHFYTDDLRENCQAQFISEIKDATVRNEEKPTIIQFAFQLLNDSTDVNNAINLLLYKMQSEFGLEAIYIYKLSETSDSVKCIFENVRDSRYSQYNNSVCFSKKALSTHLDKMRGQPFGMVYDITDSENRNQGIEYYRNEAYKSYLHVDLRLFSKTIGCIDYIAGKDTSFWTDAISNEFVSVSNLLAVCLYYGDKVKMVESSLLKYNTCDSLTGLLKEESFVDAAGRAVADKRVCERLAVVYCDISNFKYINEVYGYIVGDHILKDMADYLTNEVKNVVCAGRFYSDNLLAIYKFSSMDSDETITAAVDAINSELSAFLGRKYSINGLFVRCGVYIIDDNHTEPLWAVSNANMARKLAKSEKRSHCVLFDKKMYEKRKRQIEFIQKLDSAIENDEFYICLQPKVSGNDNNIVGAEALVRWKPDDRTEILPGDFVPAFEKNGNISKLDFYVYEKCFAYIRKRLDENKKVVPISMNVSQVDLQLPDFVPRLRTLIEKYNVPAQYIELELTESTYLENIKDISGTVSEIRSMGIRIGMDDFGTGYSSLTALNDLQVDLLKIDRIFMKNSSLKESDKTIIKFIIEMARNLRLQVVCEGVETPEQRKFLNEVGCNLHQGFYYSKPVSLDIFTDYLENEEAFFAKIS